MNKFRFERTAYGWKAYVRCFSAYVYFGHFRTQASAIAALREADQA